MGSGNAGYIQNTTTPGVLENYYTPDINTSAGLNKPSYGTFNNFSAKNIQDFVNNSKPLVQPTAIPTTTPTSATPNSGNATWDKLVSDFTASHPKFQPAGGWQVNPSTQAAYADLAKQYQDAVAKQSAARSSAQAAGAQDLASAMKQYGVSAYDLATSGALTPQQYTQMFRPSYQTQEELNPKQQYQPIYQTQYANYASPAYGQMAGANNMGMYNQRAQQQYVNPMSMLGGSFNPYTNSFGGQGYGIDSLLGQLGGYLDQYMSKYQQPTTQTGSTPTVTTPTDTTPTDTTPTIVNGMDTSPLYQQQLVDAQNAWAYDPQGFYYNTITGEQNYEAPDGFQQAKAGGLMSLLGRK